MACCGGGAAGGLDEENAKVELLMKASPFGVCLDTDEELGELARSFARLPVREGDELPESPFYIVSQGDVEIISKETGEHMGMKHAGARAAPSDRRRPRTSPLSCSAAARLLARSPLVCRRLLQPESRHALRQAPLLAHDA